MKLKISQAKCSPSSSESPDNLPQPRGGTEDHSNPYKSVGYPWRSDDTIYIMLNEARNVFIVGIKGVGMANLALILKKMGKSVVGSDTDEEFITSENLKRNNITTFVGFNTSFIPSNTDLLIYSAAHRGIENPQVQFALQNNIRVLHQAEVLAQLMDMHEIKIAVCGSHGKTTTSALLAYCLKQLGQNPTYMVGTSSFNSFPGGDYGDGKYIVVEADEYAIDPPRDTTPKFHKLRPDYVICTNIDFDHPDVFKDLDDVKKAFTVFFDNVNTRIYACEKDKSLMSVLATVPKEKYTLYGQHDKDFEIGIPGAKNRLNALGVRQLLIDLGFKDDEIVVPFKNFTGAKRRFEQVAYENDIYLFDDYAHHPNEIRATIEAARSRFNDRRIIVIFQPHTYTRTAALRQDFVHSLAKADVSFVAPIFASAREKENGQTITSRDLEQYAHEQGIENIHSFETQEELFGKLQQNLHPGDIIFTMGAGDIYKLKSDIIEVIRKAK
ncbi:UDP-N-acetylmuramate--L-alanine ligase [Candidatus Roizmanbacteria bacterium]|nr:UDP-N-acetylmuramate--L-alanine ligase [Candidatus Roizmanbacteria bacterium]